jgi:XTP/dITP diphosphohydrolase
VSSGIPIRIVLATRNAGKKREFDRLLLGLGIELEDLSAHPTAPDVEESGDSYVANALLKASQITRHTGLPALADDSGLEVDCLDGAPGIFSARWAGPGKDFALAMTTVHSEVAARDGWRTPPKANFISVLCLASPDGETKYFEGKVFGHLVWPPRGGNGFGYDPMFVPDGDTRTFGEMEPKEKYAISHRTRAFAAFKAAMLDHLPRRPIEGTGEVGRDLAALSAAAASLSTRTEAAAFIARLKDDFVAHRGEWKAERLDSFLDALGWQLAHLPASDEPAWRELAKAMLAASDHE